MRQIARFVAPRLRGRKQVPRQKIRRIGFDQQPLARDSRHAVSKCTTPAFIAGPAGDSDVQPQSKVGIQFCFTGGEVELDAYLALGLHIGITGWACDERRGRALRDSVPRIPRERLLIETDAPYLLPRDLLPAPKSRRNEPGYLPHIAATVARLRGENVEAVGAATTRNAVALFALEES